MRPRARAFSLFFALLAGSYAQACTCVSEPPSQAFEFEGDCADPTCGFRAERGAVERATTLLPGEHGLSLEPGTRVTRSVEVPWRGPRVTFVTRCERDAEVVVEVRFETSESPRGTTRVTRTARVRHAATAEWTEAFGTLDTMGPVYDGVVTAVSVETSFDARCLVDSIYVGVTRTQCP